MRVVAGGLTGGAALLMGASSGLAVGVSGAGTEAMSTVGAAKAAPPARVAPDAPEPWLNMALIYATAVKALVGGESGVDDPRSLYVMKRFCPDPAAAPPPMRCTGAVLPPDVRQTISVVLRDRARVSYIVDGRSVTLPDLSIRGDGTVLSVGRARFKGATVLVPLSTRSGPLAGMGLTYRLAYRNGSWVVTETIPGWIS